LRDKSLFVQFSVIKLLNLSIMFTVTLPPWYDGAQRHSTQYMNELAIFY